jgi:phage recombination protein Bet
MPWQPVTIETIKSWKSSEDVMSTEIVTKQTTALVADEWSPERVDLLKRTICKGSSNDELAMFLQVCKRTGLDPFARQVYAVKRWTKDGDVMTIQTSIDGFRLIAERSGKYAGQLGAFWCGSDGIWKDVWLDSVAPRAAKIGILHLNFKEPLWAVATLDQYIQTYKDKSGNVRPTGMWEKMAPVMLAKCAESLGLRRAFPQELSGLYTTEEMGQAETVKENTPMVSDPNVKRIEHQEQYTAVSAKPAVKISHEAALVMIDTPEFAEVMGKANEAYDGFIKSGKTSVAMANWMSKALAGYVPLSEIVAKTKKMIELTGEVK